MDKTHCFYIITTVKPNIRVNRLGAVLPRARSRFTQGEEPFYPGRGAVLPRARGRFTQGEEPFYPGRGAVLPRARSILNLL